jgi:LuxR family transcriptional regulator, maltose regulon positive regulatory protein
MRSCAVRSSEAWSGAGGPGRLSAPGIAPRPRLLDQLAGAARVTVVTGPPGSGKTVLLRSWMAQARLAGRAAWVPVDPRDPDPQGLWLSVMDALRETVAGSAMVSELTAAPDLDPWWLVERLLKDLAPLAEPLWLLIDDVHELGSADALRQLELLLMRAPSDLRFVLSARQDVPLGLHRLRLEGELTEIRWDDLRFNAAEAQGLFAASGVEVTGRPLATLVDKTEGLAAGLRLAAMSLAGHRNPEQFAAEFSGSERTVAEYLLAEVLDRQTGPVRRLLLRTSILDRVNGELADLLTGGSGGEGMLHDLVRAGACVVPLDTQRSWFRYHRLLADLLQAELRRTSTEPVAELHGRAAWWFEEHGFALEAIRHAQAAGDWELAARLLAGQWPGLYLDGRAATLHELMTRFPGRIRAADAALAAMAASDELALGSLEAAEEYLELAERAPVTVAGQARVLTGVVRLLAARQRGNLQGVAAQAERLQALADAPGAVPGEELRALVLVSLGATEIWTAPPTDARRHLEQGAALARRIGRPYLEFSSLAYQAMLDVPWSYALATEHSEQAIELAERHGWTDDPAAGIAYVALGSVLAQQARPEDAEPWIERAERVISPASEPVAELAVRFLRGIQELARGRESDAAAAFEVADRVTGRLAAPGSALVWRNRALLLYTLVRLGETARVERALAGFGEADRERGEIRVATAELRLAEGNPGAASAVLAPVLDESLTVGRPTWLVLAFLLKAVAADALGDQAGAARALEHALELTVPDGALVVFLLHPAAGLLERHARGHTAHPALITAILGLLSGSAVSSAPPPLDPLSKSEIRVLGYLPTHLTAPEIARELSVSLTTVKTHMRNLYTKLDVHSRAEAVQSARALGLLAPGTDSRSGDVSHR